jgi:hypothetical protein
MKRNLYMLAMRAMKPDVQTLVRLNPKTGNMCVTMCGELGEEVELFHQHGLTTDYVLAESCEDAEAIGLERMKAICRESEGWIDHFAAATLITPDVLERLLEQVRATHTPQESEDDSLPLM